MRTNLFASKFKVLNKKPKYLFNISKSGSTFFLIFLTILILLSSSIASSKCVNTIPIDPVDPAIIIELESYEVEIDTSPDITFPEQQLAGVVTLLSQTPYVSINLTIGNIIVPWNCTIEPDRFNLTISSTGSTTQDIELTITSPPGLENGTEQQIIITGTWSYIPEIPGVPYPEPLHGSIGPVYFNATAINETSDNQNGDGDGDGDQDGGDGDADDDKGAMLNYGVIAAIICIIVVILVLVRMRKRKKKE